MIMKTVLITGSIAFVGVLCVILLTLFGPTTVTSQYVKFAIMMVFVLGHPSRIVLVRDGAERKER